MHKYILVTGANGFIGKTLVRKLLEKGFLVRAAVRTEEQGKKLADLFTSSLVEYGVVGDLAENKDWNILSDTDAVIHLAARVHVLNDTAKDPLSIYRRINVDATEQLANAAAKAGVRRFVYLSSIKVNGEQTIQQPFTESDQIFCMDPYGKSKWEAEQVLQKLSQTTSLETVTLRPPLVYGRGVKANFYNLLKLVECGLPIPLASVKNKRSMIYVENLTDAIISCLTHQKAVGQTYLVSDNETVSTAELIREMANAQGKPARLWPFPLSIMRIAGKVLGKSAMVDRLLESLVVDASKIKRELNWNPPYTLRQALQRDFSK